MYIVLTQYIILLSILVPFITGIKTDAWSHPAFKILLVYIFLDGICNIVVVVMCKFYIVNMPVFHLYTVVELVVCSLLYRQFYKGSMLQQIPLPLAAVFVAGSILSTIFLQGLFIYNSYTRSVETIIIIVYALLFFYKLLGADLLSFKKQVPYIWINAAFLLYFAGSMFLFMFPSIMLAPRWIYEAGWIIHAVLLLMMYIFFTVAFIKQKSVR